MSAIFDGLGLFASGWRKDLESVRSLHASSVPFRCGSPAEVPEEVNHRSWLQIEMQSSLSSCSGHALTSSLEVCNRIATGGGVVQLSRMFAYLVGQKQCGLIGRDEGCTIEGVVDGAKLVGSCLEATFPYPNRYMTDIPAAAIAEAPAHKIRTHTPMRSYDDCFGFLSAGLGSLIAGVRWVNALAQNNGVVERLGGRMWGYHAIPLVGYTRRKDPDGRHYLDLPNSHDVDWGDQGWAEIAPRVVDQWFEEGAVIIGVSDLETFSPRQIKSWKGALSS